MGSTFSGWRRIDTRVTEGRADRLGLGRTGRPGEPRPGRGRGGGGKGMIGSKSKSPLGLRVIYNYRGVGGDVRGWTVWV